MLSIAAGWLFLSILLALAFGRIAALGERAERLASGLMDLDEQHTEHLIQHEERLSAMERRADRARDEAIFN
jgi:hypothetical protein